MFSKRRKIAFEEEETTSSAISKNDYEVFLSFRGPDTRQGFTDCLYHSMVDAGISVFRDDDELRPGDKLVEILRAIDHSKLCVVVFSRTFAASPWCLGEVERMIGMKKEIVPIFYDVTPDDVKLKTPLYNHALTAHGIKYEKNQVQEWEDALKSIGAIKGRELKNSGFWEFIKQLVKEILTKLRVKHKYEIKNLIEVPDEVEAALKLLDIGSGGRRFLGIYGMGGIGKTTLAKIVFNQISDNFDCSCFLENVREYSSQGQPGLRKLQELLLKSLDPSLRDATQIIDPMEKIRKNFTRRKVIIVLDDIDQTNHIYSLIGDSSSFSNGSRIILTTRNTRLHEQDASSNSDSYGLEKKEMDSKQALKLFSKHAFGEDSPPEDFKDLSSVVVSMTGGLPLALEVVGSFLYRRNAKVWRSTIQKLKEVPIQDVQQKLSLSYDALDSEQQEIFLDIACFFIGQYKTDAVYMWEACGFHPDHGIEVLISMSLIKINEKKCFCMHDQLRDFGRSIVKEKSKDPKAGSRLWVDHKDAIDLLNKNVGNKKVEALQLDGCSYTLDCEDVIGLEKLRFLRLEDGAKFSADFGEFIPKLRWLSVEHGSSFVATDLCLRELAVLNIACLKFGGTPRGWTQILISENLKVLTLWKCKELVSMPDLSKLVNLERLSLLSCKRLTSIHRSIGKLQQLRRLTITKSYCLRELPMELSSLEVLRHIVIENPPTHHHSSSNLNLPKSMGRLVSLTRLEISYSRVTKLPNSICELVKLKRLSLAGCECLEVLPHSIGDLRSLVSLNLSYTGISELPATTCQLAKLESLCLAGCNKLKGLPDSIGNLLSLVDLNLEYSSIVVLPYSFTKLVQLRFLNMADSTIERLPDSFGDLISLQKLYLERSRVKLLPHSVRDLQNLEVLTIGCAEGEWIEELHELPIGLTKLQIRRVRKIPNLSNLINLCHLMIDDGEFGRSLEQLEPLDLEGIEKLSKLKVLQLFCSNVKSLPMELSALEQLRSVELYCPNLELMRPQLPSSLEDLLLHIKPGAQLRHSNLSNLKNLSDLSLRNFVLGADVLGPEVEVLHMSDCIVDFNNFPVPRKLRSLSLNRCHSCSMFPALLHMLPDLLQYAVMLNSPGYDSKSVEIPRIGSQLQTILSNWKSLSELKLANFAIEGFKSLGVEESLEKLNMLNCIIEFNSFPELGRLRDLFIESCYFPWTFLDMSCLDQLHSLEVHLCDELLESPGIGKLKSLTRLIIKSCGSLQRIEDLSELSQLKTIVISFCTNFQGIDGLDRLLLSAGTVSHVSISGCKCEDVLYEQKTS